MPVKRIVVNPKSAQYKYTRSQVKELLKCSKDPIYFIEKYCHINTSQGPMRVKLYDFQKDMILAIHNNDNTAIACSRQMGKSMAISLYTLWLAQFKNEQNILFGAPRRVMSTQLLDVISFAYLHLPAWLKFGLTHNNKNTIAFANGSRIIVATANESLGKGMTINFLYLDEFAHFEPNSQKILWSALYPAINGYGKICIATSMSNKDGLFYQLLEDAEHGRNNFKPMRITWRDHPDRDAAFEAHMRAYIGDEAFELEHEGIRRGN